MSLAPMHPQAGLTLRAGKFFVVSFSNPDWYISSDIISQHWEMYVLNPFVQQLVLHHFVSVGLGLATESVSFSRYNQRWQSSTLLARWCQNSSYSLIEVHVVKKEVYVNFQSVITRHAIVKCVTPAKLQ